MGHAPHNSGKQSAAGDERSGFDKDQPSESPGKRTTDSGVWRRGQTPATFDDEAKPGPAPIESTTDDNVRSTPPKNSAGAKKSQPPDADVHTDATMPPGEGRDPKRNTM